MDTDTRNLSPMWGCTGVILAWQTTYMSNTEAANNNTADAQIVRDLCARQVKVGDVIVGRYHSLEVMAADTSDGVTKITTVSSYGAVRSEFYPAGARVTVVAR